MANYSDNITIESTPSGALMPSWLQDAICQGEYRNLLILYPNESSRQIKLTELSRINSSIDSSRHLTIKRLIRALLTDFRQPNVIEDDSILLFETHQECVTRASKGNFPLLHIRGKKWGIGKTQRLIQLHKEIAKLPKIPLWDSDPGVKEFRNALFAVEQTLSGTHPDLMQHHLNQLLDGISDTNLPFNLRDLTGIILLDHPPEFAEIERQILAKIAKHVPIHQLCNPGKFRLGYSGAYLQDVAWCSQEDLPSWVPHHEVEIVNYNAPWQSSVAIDAKSKYHRVVVERSDHCITATTILLESLAITPENKVLIIDADMSSREHRWRDLLRYLGLHPKNHQQPINQEPLIQELIYHLQLANGLEAWSFEKLRRLANSNTIALNFALDHPIDSEIKPRPHIDILENIARSFHVLGGPGAAERWDSTLSQTNEQIGDYDDSTAIKQEETQWWVANVINLWNVLADTSLDEISTKGCYSGESYH